MSDKYTILILMNATPRWLALSRQERTTYYENTVLPIFARYAKTCAIRFFDSEFFHATVSDFMLIETNNLKDYRYLIEELRDSKIYAIPYFEIKDIITGKENAFQEYNDKHS